MTRRERLERKLEKRREWAETRKNKAHAEWEKGDLREEKSGIPFGQPILVGHHSEGRHHRAIERANNACGRAVEHQDMADHHESKADGLETQLETTIFSDDENAVEALEAKVAKLEAKRKKNNMINKIIRKAPTYQATPEKIKAIAEATGMSEGLAAKYFEKDCCGRIGVPPYVNQNLGGRIKAAKDRIKRITYQNAVKAMAENSPNGVIIKGKDYISVTFAEKPDREILNALKIAGFYWGNVSWNGRRENLPECVKEMAGESDQSKELH